MREQPVNVKLFDVESFMAATDAGEVTSLFIMESSTTQFAVDGLYSEVIFGLPTSPDRLTKYGYINLHTKVFQPQIYNAVTKLKQLYKEILEGKRYAIFDTSVNNFVAADMDDEEADTGFTFFMNHFHKLKFTKSKSLSRNDKIVLIDNNRDIAVISKYTVSPAGIRDYRVNADGRTETEEINKLYLSLLALSKAIPSGYSEDPAYDIVRVSIQRKVVEIYQYILNIISGPNGGKNGFIQRKWGSRVVALSGRNVISASDLAAKSIDDPTFHSVQETKLPLFQAAKEFAPIVINQLNRLFFSYMIKNDEEQVSVIDTKSYDLVYKVIPPKIRKMYATPEGLSDIIDLFEDEELRNSPVYLMDEENKPYYTHLVYDTDDKIFIFRSLATFKDMMLEEHDTTIDMAKVRPLTMTDMLTVATWAATRGKYVTITRYPVIAIGSMYPSKVHLMTTDPSRTIQLSSEFTQDTFEIAEYPFLNTTYIDSTIPHPSALEGLDGDYDGDEVSVHSIMTKEAIAECEAYLNSPAAFVTPEKKMIYGINTDLLKLVMFNFMRSA